MLWRAGAGGRDDQVPADRETLLRVARLCHRHASPRRPGERDCQAITGKIPANKLFECVIISNYSSSPLAECYHLAAAFGPVWYLITLAK